MNKHRILGLTACISLVLLLSPAVLAGDKSTEEEAPALQALEFADFVPDDPTGHGNQCSPEHPINKATCVPPNGCGTFVCEVDSDCDELCCGPNFGRCVSACAPKPNTKACICLA